MNHNPKVQWDIRSMTALFQKADELPVLWSDFMNHSAGQTGFLQQLWASVKQPTAGLWKAQGKEMAPRYMFW